AAPPRGAVLPWGGPAAMLPPTLRRLRLLAAPPRGAVLPWGGPAARRVNPPLVILRAGVRRRRRSGGRRGGRVRRPRGWPALRPWVRTGSARRGSGGRPSPVAAARTAPEWPRRPRRI